MHNIEILCELLANTKDVEFISEILSALLTDREAQQLANRLEILQLLFEGNPQRQVAESVNVGIATVTRGAKALENDKTQIFTTEFIRLRDSKT